MPLGLPLPVYQSALQRYRRQTPTSSAYATPYTDSLEPEYAQPAFGATSIAGVEAVTDEKTLRSLVHDYVRDIPDPMERAFYSDGFEESLAMGFDPPTAYKTFQERMRGRSASSGYELSRMPFADPATRATESVVRQVPFVSDETAKMAAEFFIPQTLEETAVAGILGSRGAAPVLKGATAKTLPRIAAGEFGQEVVGTAGAVAGAKGVQDLGLPEELSLPASIIGGIGAGLGTAAAYNATRNMGRPGAMPQYGAGFGRPPEDDYGDDVMRLINGDGDTRISRTDKSNIAKLELEGSNGESIILDTGHTIKKLDNGSFNIIKPDGEVIPVRDAYDNWESLADTYITNDTSLSDTMRRALSDEDLGDATANAYIKEFADEPGGWIGSKADDTRVYVKRINGTEDDIAEVADFIAKDSTEEALRSAEVEARQHQGEYLVAAESEPGIPGKVRFFRTAEEAEAYVNKTHGNLMGRGNNPFEDVDDKILNDRYASMSPDELKAEIEGINRQMAEDIYDLPDDARTAQAELEHMNRIRDAQSWLDARAGKSTPSSDPILQILRRLGDGPGTTNISGTPNNAVAYLSWQPAYMRHIGQVANEVVLTDTPLTGPLANPTTQKAAELTRDALARLGIDPSLRWEHQTETSKAVHTLLIAWKRLEMESDGLVESNLRAGWDSVSVTGARGKQLFPMNRENAMKVGDISASTGKITEVEVPWQRVFEKQEQWDLTPAQRDAINRYNTIVELAERMRESYGLPSRRKDMKDGYIYVPRQVQTIQGVEVPRWSDPNLTRVYTEILQSWDAGTRYLDPRQTLELHLKAIYKEIADMQFSDAINSFGIKASEMVPEHIRIRREQSQRTWQKVHREAQREGFATQRLYKRMFTKDTHQARTQYEAARRTLTRIKGELAGRSQLAGGKRQTPASYGARLTIAQAKVNATKAIWDEAVKLANAIPGSVGGAGRFVSPETQAKVDAADKALRASRTLYMNAMDAAEKFTGVSYEGYFRPETVAARDQMIKAETEHRVLAADARNNHRSTAHDPAVLAARQDMRDARKNYKAVLAQAKIDYPERITVKKWNQRFFPLEQAAEVEKGIYKYWNPPGPVMSLLGMGADVIRTGATSFDFAAPFIHGLPVLGRNPVAWAKGAYMNYAGAFNPKRVAQFVEAHKDSVDWLAQHEVIPSSSDFYTATQPGKGPSLLAPLDKLGNVGKEARRTARQVGRQTIGRFASGYEGALLSWRTLLLEAELPHLATRWKGNEVTLAQHIRNMTGGLDTRALGVTANQRIWEGLWMALSPRLLRSTTALIADMRYGLNDPRGLAATRALTSMVAAVTAIYVGTGLILGKDEKEILTGLNPLEGKKFLSHKVAGQWIGVGGTMRAMVQLLAGVYAAAAPASLPGGEKPVQDLWSSSSTKNPFISAIVTRGAPGAHIAGMTGEALTGANLAGFEEINGLPDLMSHIGTSAAPFTIMGMVEGDKWFGSVANILGGRTSPETPVEERAEEIELQVIPELVQRGILPPDVHTIDDLGFGEFDAVDRYLRDNRPDLVDSFQAWRRRFNSIYQDKQDKRKVIDEEYRPEMDKLYKDLISGERPQRDTLNDLASIRDEYRGRVTELYNDPEYQHALRTIERNPMQVLANDYFEIMNKYKKEKGLGEKARLTADDWDEVTKRQERYITALPTRLEARFRNDLALRDSVFDAHPIIKLKREVDTASQQYYYTPEEQRDDFLRQSPALNVQRWIVYGTALKTPEAADLALLKKSTGLTASAMRSPGFSLPIRLEGFKRRIDTDIQTWQDDKRLINVYLAAPAPIKEAIMAEPTFKATAIYWGRSERITKGETIPVLDQYMSNWSEWPQYRSAVLLYLQLPETSLKLEDKEHVLSFLPAIDAAVNVWKHFMYDEEPVFKSEAGRQAYFRLTGRDASKFSVVPPKE